MLPSALKTWQKMPLEAMKDRYAVLLANHGLLAGGKDLARAFNITEEIEYCAEFTIEVDPLGTQ